jgi:hypothetical protein
MVKRLKTVLSIIPRLLLSGTMFAVALPAVGRDVDAQENRSGIVFLYVDYESRTINSDVIGVEAAKPSAEDSIGVDCSISRRGRCSVRSKVALSDDYISFGAHRAESNTESIAMTRYSAGDHIRYGFSLYLSPDWEVDSRELVDIVWQFKRFGMSPDMFVGVKERDIVLRATRGKQALLVKNYPVGKWIDFRIDVFWSPEGDGRVSVAVRLPPAEDYIETATIFGENMGNARPKNAYLKWGLYKPGYKNSKASHPRIVFHDEIYIERLD